MIRIFHIISDSNIGGAGRYILNFLECFDRKRFEVCVALPKHSKLVSEIHKLDIKTYEIENMAERSFAFAPMVTLTTLLKQKKPDIVHTHGALSGRIAAKLAGIKNIIYTRHSVFEPKMFWKRGLGFLISRTVSRLTSTKIIAVAEAARQNLLDTGVDNDKIVTIYNGVPEVPIYEQSEIDKLYETYMLPKNDKILAIIARVTAIKGHLILLRAVKILLSKGVSDFHVCIAGTGPTSFLLELRDKILEFAVEQYVTIMGFVKDPGALENAMYIQVNASYGTEAASLSLLEGMSLGKPAVVSSYGGNPELIDGENGLVFEQKNAEDLADKLETLLTDPVVYTEMSMNAIEKYKQKYTAQIMTKEMEDLYEKVKLD